MSTTEAIAFIAICILAGILGGLLIIRHLNSKAWQSIAKTIKEDYDGLVEKFDTQRRERDNELMWLATWMKRAKAAEQSYAHQSERMAAIVAENQTLRRSNAQLKRREGRSERAY